MNEAGKKRLWRVVKLMLVDALIIVICAYAALLTKFAPNIDKEELLALNLAAWPGKIITVRLKTAIMTQSELTVFLQ